VRWDGPPLEAWAPWRPDEIARRLAGTPAHWAVVGGWAIDLFLGRGTRAHEDLEIAVPRAELALVRAALAGFAFHAVGDGEVRELAPAEETPPERHQNWVLDPAANAWRVDVMLEPGDSVTWVWRRDETLRAPRTAMIATRDGVPYLRPEAVLLYKAKAVREKDEADFAAVLPAMDPSARAWLRAALARAHPRHAWLERLA
jgi:hypothetical protein